MQFQKWPRLNEEKNEIESIEMFYLCNHHSSFQVTGGEGRKAVEPDARLSENSLSSWLCSELCKYLRSCARQANMLAEKVQS